MRQLIRKRIKVSAIVPHSDEDEDGGDAQDEHEDDGDEDDKGVSPHKRPHLLFSFFLSREAARELGRRVATLLKLCFGRAAIAAAMVRLWRNDDHIMLYRTKRRRRVCSNSLFKVDLLLLKLPSHFS